MAVCGGYDLIRGDKNDIGSALFGFAAEFFVNIIERYALTVA